MNDKKVRVIHTAAGIVISTALAAAAVCLILSAYTIYKSGESPYTPESIGAEYAKIAVPLWIAVGSVFAGIILNIALPMPKSKAKALKDPFIRLRIMQKKLPDGVVHDGIARQCYVRKAYRAFFSILCAGSFVPAVIALCDYDYFTVDNLNPALFRTVGLLAVGVVISGILLFILSVIERRSAEQEIEWTKVALLQGAKVDKKVAQTNDGKVKIVRLVLVGAACALIVIGLTQDGFYDVLQKAIRICTECIGLG